MGKLEVLRNRLEELLERERYYQDQLCQSEREIVYFSSMLDNAMHEHASILEDISIMETWEGVEI